MSAKMTAALLSLSKTTPWRNWSSAMAMAVLLSAIIACSTETQVREVEVTREVPVTQEVPVTVETVKTVEVTHEVPVTQEIPVTVETIKTVEVTREVPVTRIVSATPIPETPGTPKESPTETPAPTLTRVPAVAMATPTATPASETASQRFGSWKTSDPTLYSDRQVFHFHNVAVEWETSLEAPILTYLCDTRGGRSLYIDWGFPLSTERLGRLVNYRPDANDDPYRPHPDYNVDMLVDLADRLLTFVEKADLSERDLRKWDDSWKEMQRQWQSRQRGLGPQTPDELIEYVDLFLSEVLINLDFFPEKADQDNNLPYGPPILDTISREWYVISRQRTKMEAAGMGELRRAYRSYSPAEAGARVMTAIVKEPEQPAEAVAKWDISGLDNIMSHCASKRQ